MRSTVKILAIAASLAALIPVCGFAPDAAVAPDVDIVVTAAPAYLPQAALSGKERFPKGAQLLLVHAGKAEPLLPTFAASADAQVSYDAKSVLFAGKQNAGDPWQIWEVTLATHAVRKVVATTADAIRPFYLPGLLPGGRVLYAVRTTLGFQLESARAREIPAESAAAYQAIEPGPTVVRLSYLPASAVPVDLLQDGRILFEAGFPLGTGSTPELFLAYADGSGVESYRCDHPASLAAGRWGGKQLASGDVVFTHGSTLARFTSPLASEARIPAPHAEYAGAIAETASGAWLMSARSVAGTHFALKLWKPGALSMQTLLAQKDRDLVEPVLVAPRKRPNRHPSGLHDWNYANMMALDARESREGRLKVTPTSVRLEMLDATGHAVNMGTAPVESDGSFFVKTPANTPIRFALLDAKGVVLRQEHGWFWIRGGEQRYCVGCHAGPERASENTVPAVLLHTTVPVDLSELKTAASQPLKTPGGK